MIIKSLWRDYRLKVEQTISYKVEWQDDDTHQQMKRKLCWTLFAKVILLLNDRQRWRLLGFPNICIDAVFPFVFHDHCFWWLWCDIVTISFNFQLVGFIHSRDHITVSLVFLPLELVRFSIFKASSHKFGSPFVCRTNSYQIVSSSITHSDFCHAYWLAGRDCSTDGHLNSRAGASFQTCYYDCTCARQFLLHRP